MNRQAELQFVMRLHVTLDPAVAVGRTSAGTLNIIPIPGGTVEGDGFTGTVCRGGADWNTMRPDGLNHMYARYWLRTEDGKYISVENEGVIDWNRKDSPYITTPRFSCEASGPYAALNDGIYIGELHPGPDHTVDLVFWKVME